MLEKDIENLIAQHPHDIFPGEGFKLIGQQTIVEGRRLDILFECAGPGSSDSLEWFLSG